MTKPPSSNLYKSKKTTQSQEFPTLKQLDMPCHPSSIAFGLEDSRLHLGQRTALCSDMGRFQVGAWVEGNSAAESQETYSGQVYHGHPKA